MSVLKNIQQQIADLLAAQSFFSNITVLTDQAGDIFDAMDKALGAVTDVGGKAGAFVVVMLPDANVNATKELYGPFFDEVAFSIQVTVNIPVANDPSCGVGVNGLDICEAVCNTLSQFFPAGANAPLIADSPTIKLVDRGDNTTTHLVRYKTQAGIRAVPTQCATPTIVNNAGVITLSTTTPGAAIFYTIDGSNPVPINQLNTQVPQTILYTGPFNPGPGITLKARAFLAGYLNSATAQTML